MINNKVKTKLITLAFASLSMVQLSSCSSTNLIQDNSFYVSDLNEVTSTRITSPDAQVDANVFIDSANKLNYQVNFNGQTAIKSSPLGIVVNGVNLGEGVRFKQVKSKQINQTYLTRGTDTHAHDFYREWLFELEHIATQKAYKLAFRLYNDGIAYRYLVDGEGTQLVNGEVSSWTLPEETKTWFFERDSNWKLKSYAGWWKQADIAQMPRVSKQGPIQGTPLVFELPNQNGYAVATKAALYNYSGMRLKAIGDNRFQANFTEGNKGFKVEGDIKTPWRVTMLAKSLDALVNSDLIENLNPEPDPELFSDTRYIEPGRSVWSWMSMRLGTIQDQNDFVEYAAQMGFEYTLIDDGWKDWENPWATLKTITAKADKLGVKVWVWVDSKDISNPENDYQQMRAYLAKVKSAGACGVKTDFMNSEAKELIDFEINFLEKSAEQQLLVNFHGSHSSTGEAKTYPNELTREGIRGIEVNLHKNGHLPASHNAALPFTRFLVGQGDYTPLYFTNPGPTTYAHQLATPIIFYSPVQIYADNPEFMQTNPHVKPVLDIIKSIPTVWHETKVLEGSKIGEIAAFARRHNDTWYVAVLNNEDQKEYELDLSFLTHHKFDIQIVEDDFEATRIDLVGLNKMTAGRLGPYTSAMPLKRSNRKVNNTEKLRVKLASGGGFVAVLRPAEVF